MRKKLPVLFIWLILSGSWGTLLFRTRLDVVELRRHSCFAAQRLRHLRFGILA
jgi:hypothetical protein